MHVEPQFASLIGTRPVTASVRPLLLVALCLGVVLAVFHPSYLEMARIWARSETFAHGFLVLPAFAFLVWRQRADLLELPVKPCWPALLAAAVVAFVWLMGELSSARTPSFFAAVLAVPVAVAAALGLPWVRALSLPLALLVFAVPFGEVFVPSLIDWTADFTVAALRAGGVPVFREAQDLVLPNGHWSVVEACSGIRYLIASLFVGVLFAWHFYRSPLRRAAFIAFSALVPIVANWVRAYAIVLLGYLSDNRIAAGVDHLLYGWVFFGVVIGLMFLVGTWWRDDHPVADRSAGVLGRTGPGAAGAGAWPSAFVALGAVGMLLAAAPLVAGQMMRAAQVVETPLLAVAGAHGWARDTAQLPRWTPNLVGPRSEQVLAFRRGDAAVGLFVGFYREQRQGAELVNSVNALLPVGDRGLVLDRGVRSVRFGRAEHEVRTARLRLDGQQIVAWHWYWLGASSTISDARAKLDLAFDRLRGRDDTSAWVTLFTVEREGGPAADAVLEAFAAELGDAVEAGLARVRDDWR